MRIFFVSKNILIYSSETDDNQIETLKNIHYHWGLADVILTTPSITVGNSYKPKTIDVDNIFCFAAPTCCVCDTFQGMKRVRETKSNNLYFCLPEKASLSSNKRFASHKFEILRNYDSINIKKNNRLNKLIQELLH